MRKRFKYARLIIIFFGTLGFYYEPVYAQRAGTTIERNDDAHKINELYKKGQWEQGKEIAEEELKRNPKDSDMRMLLGKYYLHKKVYDKARYELVKSLEYAPANVDSKHMLVSVETESERYSSAICYINELLEVNPYWKGLWRKKIELYRIMGNDVEADRLLKRISQIYPEDNDLQVDKVYAFEQRALNVQKSGKIDESIEIGRKSIENKPEEPSSYVSVIDNFIKAGDYNNALVYSERGLNQFPGNSLFIQKKISILEHQQRYSEILSFLDTQMSFAGRGASLRSQYDYFLLEAARNAKGNTPATLYGRIFEGSPGNIEAFDYVFNSLIADQQYEEAIGALERHRKTVGASKGLDMKELMVYRRMGNHSRIAVLTREYFAKYPNDSDLQESFVAITLHRARESMAEGKINDAILDWKDIIQYGNEESVQIAQKGLYNAYVSEKRYQEAIMMLDDMLLDKPGDQNLLIKKADMYYQQGRYEYALTVYEQVLDSASPQDKERLLIGYSEFIVPVVKELREAYRLEEARNYTERWLSKDTDNQDAFLSIINLSYQLKDSESMLRYAKLAEDRYSDDVEFKIKLAEAMNHRPEQLADSWSLLHNQVRLNPFHAPLLNTFTHTTEEYARTLLKDKKSELALSIIDSALLYKEDSKSLKYMKGLAYEGMKQFDSAYYYQQFYEPSLLEFQEFKEHLNYLSQRSFKNNVGIAHLRARYGDDYAITSISTLEYSRLLENGSSWGGRINYAGREDGKGIQGLVEWNKPWTSRLSSRVDFALSNKFFSKIAANVSAVYQLKPTWDGEGAIGFRRFFTGENLANLNLGVSKELENWKLDVKLGNFFLDSEGEVSYLYSFMGRAQYYMNNPRNYILAVGSIGNTPDVDLLDRQLYNSFDVFNAMIGAGLGRSITKNMTGSIMGTWYNFQAGEILDKAKYRNLYNLYFQLNVLF